MTYTLIARGRYPITPVRLGARFVEGRERCVTQVSGRFSLSGNTRIASVSFRSFDGDGWLVQYTRVASGGSSIDVVVPLNGFAVISANDSM